MKNIRFSALFSVTAFFCTIVLAGCNGNSYSGKANLDNNIDSVSYAFGFNIGSRMHQQGMADLDPSVFANGMNVALQGDSSAIPKRQMMASLRAYQMEAQQNQKKEQMKEGKKNKSEGQAFLKKNKSKDGVKTTESGLQYKVLKKGSGASPDSTDKVLVNYSGKLLDGTVFDSNDSTSIPLNRVIPGWTEGIQLMHEGATYEFWIPGDLAYGPNPRPGGPIGPNQTLHFNVDLLKIEK